MAPGTDSIALLYDDDAYVETHSRSSIAPTGGSAPLMGRRVAGQEFLDAYLRHGTSSQVAAVVYNEPSKESLLRQWREHPATQARQRRLTVIDGRQFHQRFLPKPPAPLLYIPGPPDPSFAWARRQGGADTYALSGVTHTLCTATGIQLLRELLLAPFEPYDSLICTSRAVADKVRALTGAYADYLRERLGGDPKLRLRLETIPWE